MYIGILFPIMLLCFRYDFHDFRIDDKPYKFLSFGSFCLQHQLFQAPLRNVMHVLRVPISAYGNYTSAHDSNWNFGISIGAFILAPKFLH